jgi:hypothetical protein
VDSDLKALDEDPYADIIDDDDICDSDALDGLCDTIKTLYDAGVVFVFFELIVIILIVLWIVFLVIEVVKSQFLPNVVGYIFPAAIFLCHFLGLVCWAGVTEVEWGDCDDTSKDDEESVCGEAGPALAIFIILVFLFVFPAFAFVWWKKDNVESSSESGSDAERRNLPAPAGSNQPAQPVAVSYPNQGQPQYSAAPAQQGAVAPPVGSGPPPSAPGSYPPPASTGSNPPPPSAPTGSYPPPGPSSAPPPSAPGSFQPGPSS